MPTAEPIHLKDYTPPAHGITTCRLVFSIHDDHTEVRSQLEISRRDGLPDNTPLTLNATHMTVLEVAVDGVSRSDWKHDGEILTVPGLPPQATVSITNSIDPASNKALEGLYKSGAMYCTQCEPEGFRRITPFVDRPDNPCRFHVRVEADKARYPVLLSNGNPAGAGDLEGGRHWTAWDDPFNKPSYLFALVAGDLGCVSDSFTTRSGKTVPLNIYVDHGNEERCTWAMDSLKRSMKWDEDTFGLEYDLDVFNIVAVDAFNMGAMENKGLNIFNSQAVLAKPETATDANFENIEGIVAHEYFHNWTGNRVTCRDWFQLTLKEGLTVFRDQEFSSDMNSRPVCRIGDVNNLRNMQFPEDSGPNAHPIRPSTYLEINNFYTSTVYQKGSEIIRMIHTLIGPENFRKGMDLYFERHDGQAVTCEEFVGAMTDASGTDLSGMLNTWYRQAGTPTVTVTRSAHDKAAGTLTLTIAQEGGDRPFLMPMRIGLVGETGELPVTLEGETTPGPTTRVFTLDGAHHSVTLTGVTEDVIVSANRGFSAPVNLVSDNSADEDLVLFERDSDPVNRWDAGQRLATRSLEAMIADASSAPDDRLIDAYGRVIGDTSIDPAFKAELLGVPSLTRLLEGRAGYPVDATDLARRSLRRALAAAHRAALETLYADLADQGPFEINAAAFGRRRLRITALSYLMELDDEPVWTLIRNHHAGAQNMTDEEASLALALNTSMPDTGAVVDGFKAKWSHEPLVMNKWFGAQAGSRSITIDRLNELYADEAFDRYNPNKVRSLAGLFSHNLPRFHDASGSGYAWFAAKVLEADSFNSTLAGRLAKGFGKFAVLDAERQAKLRPELEKILATEGLSKDVTEIVGKTLESAPAAAAR